MDVKDNQILYELSKNSRISNKKLAQKIRLSAPSTLNRLNNLVNKDILLNTHAIVDNSALGYKCYRLYFSFRGTTPKKEKEIVNWLKSNQLVSVLAICSGSIDIAILIWVKDDNSFYSFYESLKLLWGPKLANIQIFSYIKTLHFARSYLLNKKSEFLFSTGSNKEVKHDAKDLELLTQLNNNAKLTSIELAQKIGLSPRSTIDRLRRLEKNKIIAGYSNNISTQKIGKEYYKLNFVLSKSLSETEKVSIAETVQGVVYIDVTLGKFDLELNVEVTNYSKIEQIINLIKERFDGIQDFNYFQVKKFEKLVFV